MIAPRHRAQLRAAIRRLAKSLERLPSPEKAHSTGTDRVMFYDCSGGNQEEIPTMTTRWWVVVVWKHANCGGESLVYRVEDGDGFAVCTGPTPWGCGSWGPFPESAIISARDLRADDSWPVNGCPSNRWTARDILESLKRNDAYRGGPITRTIELERVLAALAVQS
jgi:hypothetical protein